MWIDISCECWHEFHGISFNISYIVWTLKWISLEFRLTAGKNFPGEFRRNFFSLLYVGWALTWISLELFNTWLLLSACTNLLGNLRRAWHAAWALSTWIVEYLYMPLWLFVWILSTLRLMNLLIVLRAVSLHPWPGLTFIYVLNLVFIFVDGMRCVYPATDVSTLAACYFIYYRDIIFSVEWREFCTVFLFLYYLRWQCHALENSPTKVANS